MLKISTLLGSSILLVTASSTLFAQQPAPVKLWSGDLEFGYLDTSGNTEETTITGKADINREKEAWRNKLLFDSLNSSASGDRSAEKYFLSDRLAYQFNQYDYAFGYASYDDDRFSGFDYQATIAAGYGRRLLNDATMQWDAEIGPGYRISRVNDNSPSEDSEDVIIRLYTNYSWDITDTATFSQLVNVESGDDNTISKSITALKLKVIGNFALKLSYTVKYTEKLPNGNKHADTETAVTVAYAF
jgi:putative salt-induced outer membrane protein YdiY